MDRCSPYSRLLAGGTLALGLLLIAEPALAQNALDTITGKFQSGSQAWGPALRNYANGLFALLAMIQFGFAFIRLSIKGADLGEFLAELVTQVMFIGLFYWLLNSSGEIIQAIVNSFRQAGDIAAQAGGGSGGIRPSDIWQAGATAAARMFDADYGWDVGKAVGMIICGLVVLICFALMAAALIIALVESYIVMNASVLLMGFGGSQWTKDIAVKTLMYAVSVGAKLMVIQLLVGLGEVIVKDWVAAMPEGAVENMTLLAEMIGVSIVLLCLTFTIPGIVQGVINGSSASTGGQVVAAAAAVGAGVAAAGAAMAGGAMAVGGAAKLASAQIAAGGGSTGGIGGAAQLAGKTMGNLAKGQVQDIGNKLSGRARAGNAGGRAGMAQAEEANLITKGLGQPSVPSTGSPDRAGPASTIPTNDGEGGSIQPLDQVPMDEPEALAERIGKIAGVAATATLLNGGLSPEIAAAPAIGSALPSDSFGKGGLDRPSAKPTEPFGKRGAQPVTPSIEAGSSPSVDGADPITSAPKSAAPSTYGSSPQSPTASIHEYPPTVRNEPLKSAPASNPNPTDKGAD